MAARRTRRRRDRTSESPAVLRWLQVGAVAAGVTAAVAVGQGVAIADTGESGADKPSTTSTDDGDSPDKDTQENTETTDPGAEPGEDDPESEEPEAEEPEPEPEPESEESEPVDGEEDEDEDDSHDPVVTPDETVVEPDPTLEVPAPNDTGDRTSYRALAPAPAPRNETPETVTETAEIEIVPDVDTPVITTFSRTTSASTTSIAPIAPSYPDEVTQTPVTWQSIASNLLAWAGLGTLAADSDIPALPVNRFVEALWLDVRRYHYTYLNSYPHAAPTQVWQDPNTSTVYGTIGGYDADGDQLTYTVTEEPEHGTVTIVNGVYTYVPDATFASTGGTDTFVVTISDDGPENPWHTHGFSQILQAVGLTGPSTATVTVTVDGTGDPVVVGTPTSIDGSAVGSAMLTPDGTRVIQTTTNGNTSSTVTIINTADGSIVGSPITIDEYAGLPPVLTPNGAQLVVSTLDVVSGETTVTVINTADATVAGSSTFAGAYQAPAVVNSDSTRAYVVTYDGSNTAVTIIDLSDGTIAGRNEQPAGAPAGRPVLSPDGTRVYQSSQLSNDAGYVQVTVIDAATGAYLGDATTVGLATAAVVVSPTGERLIQTTYYQPLNKTVITVIDSDGNYVGQADAPGAAIGDPVFSQDGSRAYQTVTVYDPGLDDYVTTIVMLDGTTGTKLDEHQVAAAVVQGLRLSKDGSTAIQTTNGVDGTTVTIIDTAAGTFADVLVDGAAVDGPAIISADGTRAAVLTRSTGPSGPTATITLINADTATDSVSSSVSGSNAFGRLTQSADGTMAVALLSAGGYTTPVVIDLERGSLSQSLRYQGIPTRPAGFSADGSYVAAPLDYVDPDTGATTSLIVLRMNDGFANPVGEPVELPRYAVGAPVLSPDGSRVIQTTETIGGSPVTTVTVVDTQPVAPPSPPVDNTVTVRTVISDLLSWTGLGTLAPTSGIPDVPLPGFLQNAWRAVSAVHYTLWNSYPHAAPTQVWQNPDTGEVIGTIGGYDADGDELTYTVVDGPTNGTVTIVDGIYTYTPAPSFAENGGTDSFTVTIDDYPGNPWHRHGFSEILYRAGITGLSRQTVTVNVTPVQFEPTIAVTAGDADPGTGAVLITVVASEPSGGPVTVTADPVSAGQLVDNEDGTWTYTPDPADRLTASQVGAPVMYQPITFTATDDDGQTASDTIDVAIDPLVNTVIGSFDVDKPWSVAISNDGLTAYVTSIYHGTVTIIDTTTGDETSVLPLGASTIPFGIAVSPNGSPVYVAHFTTAGAVSVIDTDNQVADTITVGSNPRDVAFSPDGQTAYTANTSGTISVINVADGTVTTLPAIAGVRPLTLVVSADGSTLYVVNSSGSSPNTVELISAADGSHLGTISTNGVLFDIAITPDGKSLLVTSANGQNLSIISTETNAVTTTVEFDEGVPRPVAVSPDGTTAYIGVDGQTGYVAVVDIASGEIVDTIEVGDYPNGVAVSSDGKHLYVTNTDSNSVTVVSLGSGEAAPTGSTQV